MSRDAQNILAACGNPLRQGTEQCVLREWREEGAQVHGLGVEMAKGVAKPPAIDLSHDVSCRLVIENRPAADRVSVRLSSRSPKEKHRRMLGLDDERF